MDVFTFLDETPLLRCRHELRNGYTLRLSLIVLRVYCRISVFPKISNGGADGESSNNCSFVSLPNKHVTNLVRLQFGSFANRCDFNLHRTKRIDELIKKELIKKKIAFSQYFNGQFCDQNLFAFKNYN